MSLLQERSGLRVWLLFGVPPLKQPDENRQHDDEGEKGKPLCLRQQEFPDQSEDDDAAGTVEG